MCFVTSGGWPLTIPIGCFGALFTFVASNTTGPNYIESVPTDRVW